MIEMTVEVYSFQSQRPLYVRNCTAVPMRLHQRPITGNGNIAVLEPSWLFVYLVTLCAPSTPKTPDLPFNFEPIFHSSIYDISGHSIDEAAGLFGQSILSTTEEKRQKWICEKDHKTLFSYTCCSNWKELIAGRSGAKRATYAVVSFCSCIRSRLSKTNAVTRCNRVISSV